ncbi:MAG: hypothetical protein ABI843_10290 [Dokdonella sp.]
MAIEMRCPGCGTQSLHARVREPDDFLRCGKCRHEFEFRQFREAACRSHRDELLRACPDLARAFSLHLMGEPLGSGEAFVGTGQDDNEPSAEPARAYIALTSLGNARSIRKTRVC